VKPSNVLVALLSLVLVALALPRKESTTDVVLPTQVDKCSEIDRMTSVYQKCLMIAPLDSQIVIAAFRYGAKYGIEPELLLAMAFVESSFHPLARNIQCHGLLQINYNVWKKQLALDPYKLLEIDYNMDKGARILRIWIDAKHGDIWAGVFAFNNGYRGRNMTYVPKVRKFYRGIGGING
jgi:hypothetical protein